MNEELRPNSNRKKLSWWKILLIVIASLLGAIIISSSVIAIVSKVTSDALLVSIKNVEKVDYDEDILKPELDDKGRPKLDENGCYNLVDEKGVLDRRNLRVLQLTDIHIGAGAFSSRTDNWTIKTVEDLVRRTRPDFIVVTGDISYPVPFQAGTMNNKKSAKAFADLMERLEVYWTLAFGNHDSEAYSYYNREEMGEFYASDEYKYCLFDNSTKKLSTGEEVFGVGNFAINVRDKNGTLIHTMFMMDSNAYLPEDPLGIQWKYDRIHDDQLKWYEETCKKLGITKGGDIKSTMYFHIPTKDVRDTVDAWNANGEKPTPTIMLRDGKMGEYVSGGTKVPSDFYNILLSNGTTGVFCGHDHKNNASYWLNKAGFNDADSLGIRFTYGMSIDYLAYVGIYKETSQRGGRMIEINTTNALSLPSDIDEEEYDVTHFAEDKKAGFITYHIPYWKDLYKESRA